MREGKTAGNGPETSDRTVNDAAVAARTAAYAEVYRTRNTWLVTYATSLTGSEQAAADLVAETHFRVWRRLRDGDAVDNLPAFLTTTLRGLAAERGGARQETSPAPDRQVSQVPQASQVELLTRLLRELPDRWVTALWYAEVEELPAEQVGARISADASAAGVVLGRARERLRQAFLQSRPGTPTDESCAEYWKLMPSMVRDTASARRARHVTEHTATCADCRARLQALAEAHSRLSDLLGPTLLVGLLRGDAGSTVKAPAAIAAKAAPAGALMPATAPVAVKPDPSVATDPSAAPRTGAVRTGSKAAARHARERTGVVGHARARAFTKSISPAKGVLVGSVGVVGIAAAATALALGTAGPHHPAAVGSTTATSSAATSGNGGTAAAGRGDGSAGADPASTAAAAGTGAATASTGSAAPGATQSPQQSALPASQAGQQVSQAATGQASSTAPAAGPASATAPATTPTSGSSTTPATTPSSSAPTTTQPTTSTPSPSPSQTSSSPSSPPTSSPTLSPTSSSSATTPSTAPSTTAAPTDTATATDTATESPAASDSASAPTAATTPAAAATSTPTSSGS